MNSELRIAMLQMTSVDRWENNLQQIEDLLKNEKPNTLDLICLPENALYMRVKEGETVPGFDLTDPIYIELKKIALHLSAAIHVGSAPMNSKGKLTNASVLIRPDADLSMSYEKMHLFDIDLEGQKPIRESDAYHHGEKPEFFEWRGWKFGQSVCYDLRFSELYSKYAEAECDVLLVPAAFLVETGRAHWHVLLRARAIESQAYCLATAQAGIHRSVKQGQRSTYGHSLAINPWGEILAEGSVDRPEILKITLKKDEIRKVRRQIPMAAHRRFWSR